jgi:dolichyl-phosphate beta-glucosyltransferase
LDCAFGALPQQSPAVPKITLVVPCYNEATRLPRMAFLDFLARTDGATLLFVNDGSRDATMTVLQELKSAAAPGRVELLDLHRNTGKAEAVRQGFAASFDRSPDLVGFWDADLATPLGELDGFLEIFAMREDIEMVFGARVQLLGRQITRRPSRHYVGRVGATLISSSLGLTVYDTQCGAKVFRASESLRSVFAKPFLSRWIFDVEIIARFLDLWGRERTARSIYELPVREWHEVGGSKVTSTDFFHALLDLWKIRRAYRLSRGE